MPAHASVMMYPPSHTYGSPRLRIIGGSLSSHVPSQRRIRVIVFVRLNSINWRADPLHTCALRRLTLFTLARIAGCQVEEEEASKEETNKRQQVEHVNVRFCALHTTPPHATFTPHARTPARTHARTTRTARPHVPVFSSTHRFAPTCQSSKFYLVYFCTAMSPAIIL
jgi:hypothetical protein